MSTSPVSPASPPWALLAAYGGLRLPLALLELPLFVLLPAFYGQQLGVPLAIVGAVLFGARMLDALIDPLMGAGLDRARQVMSPRSWILMASPLMAVGFLALLHPPAGGIPLLTVWLALASVVTYLGWSAVTIAHQAWGAGLSFDDRGRVRVTGVREVFGLSGVLISALLLDPSRMGGLSVLFVIALLLALALLFLAPLPEQAGPLQSPARSGIWSQMWAPLAREPAFRKLLVVFMLNGTASAIPATLVLFFVADVLQAPGQAPQFLFLYFAAAAVGMPLWVALGARIDLRKAWLVGMTASVLAFVWAYALGPGDLFAYALICVLSGLALGADLAFPTALLARVIAVAGGSGRDEGAYFGLWSLATKLNLALAAGAGLTLLDLFGYQPGSGGSTGSLSLAYAALPCVLKLAAALALAWPDRAPSETPEKS